MKNLIITLCVVLAGCAGRSEWTSKHSRSHPLVGRIWDVSQNRFVDRGDLAATAVEADFLYLGEKHDNPDHHRLRSEFISELAHSGRSIALGFEQLSEEQERKLQSGGWKDFSQIEDVLGWSKSGWPPFSIYLPLFRVGILYQMYLVPAGLPRNKLKECSLDSSLDWCRDLFARFGLNQEMNSEDRKSLIDELSGSHCNMLPEELLARMLDAQRLRDAYMARQMLGAKQASLKILLAGNGHVRKDRGVPSYVRAVDPAKSAVSVALLEVQSGLKNPEDYSGSFYSQSLPFDYVWFTPVFDREDPCKKYFGGRNRKLVR